MKKVLVLGCTGSIGKSAIDVIEQFPERFTISGLTAYSSKEKLEVLKQKFNCPTYLAKDNGNEGLYNFIATNDAGIVVNGIAGSAGFMPSVVAIEAKKDLALANKETIVMAGNLIKKLANKNGTKIFPVDSEHSAVFNLIERIGHNSVSKIILTASGGPFRNYSLQQLKNVKLEDALKHPTWSMGKKITIDSATLANKGLEVIEASLLFDMAPKNIDVVVHPQSLVHSLVRTNDGELYAQLSLPDMRHPILSALSWPDFYSNDMQTLDIYNLNSENEITMTFSKPNRINFPMLDLAYFAAEKGGGYPIAFNAANEVAVESFVKGKISFIQISEIAEKVLSKDWSSEISMVDDVFSVDKEARMVSKEIIL